MDLDRTEVQVAQQRLEVERAALLLLVRHACGSFDANVAAMHRQRQEVACDFSASLARQLVYYQELLLLKVSGWEGLTGFKQL